MDQWKSIDLYEHPAKHQAGTYGNVVLSTAGVYCLRVGGGNMSCPQDWAAKIHHDETNEKTISITIKGIDPEDYRYFKIACARENVTTKQAIINLIREFGASERNDPGKEV